MNEFTILTKTEEDLINKINYLINDDEIEEGHKAYLSKWLFWYNTNKEKINLESFVDKKFFYRAYWNTSNDLFGIQVWEEKDDEFVVWNSNLYVNKPDVLDDKTTIIIK